MIVGEGLIGVLIAALVAFSGKDFPLSLVGDGFADHAAVWLGGIVFAVVIYALYRRVGRALANSATPEAAAHSSSASSPRQEAVMPPKNCS